jgi:chorismate mutase
MSIDSRQNDVLSDMQAVADAAAARRPVAPEITARVMERSRKVQEKLHKKFGVWEIAVDLIRSVRDE